MVQPNPTREQDKMNSIDQVLAAIQEADVTLWVEKGTLHYRAPKGALNPGLLALIKEQKFALISLLQETEALSAGALPMIARTRQEAMPLSFAQERLWFLEQLGMAGTSYNIPAAFHLEGLLSVRALEISLTKLVERQESLRTHLESIHGEARQVIEP